MFNWLENNVIPFTEAKKKSMRRLLRVRKPVVILDKWGMKRYLHKQNPQTLHTKDPRVCIVHGLPCIQWVMALNGIFTPSGCPQVPVSSNCVEPLKDSRLPWGSWKTRLDSQWVRLFTEYRIVHLDINLTRTTTSQRSPTKVEPWPPTCGFHCEAELFLRLQPKLVKVLYGRLIWSPLVMSESTEELRSPSQITSRDFGSSTSPWHWMQQNCRQHNRC